MKTPASDPFRDQLASALAPAYDLEREITGGGMSRVFVAVERALGRRVVVKVLPPELAAGVNKERFRREIQLAAQLQHPHIVPLLSAGEQGDLLWYTMPFVEGESLREALHRRGSLSVREVVRVLHDVVDALAYAHSRGVVHRDIKPANILTHGAHALVADFGVAKALSAAMPHSGTTSTGIAIGTPAYMAPEQLAADPKADHRVDLYAVGLLAYELLTGDQPFTGESPQATMAAQLTRMPTPLYECCPDVPADLSGVIMSCLAKSPEERPATASALLDALDALTTPTGGGIAAFGTGSGERYPSGPSTPSSGARGATRPLPSPAARRRWIVGGGIAAGLIALSLAGMQLKGVRVTDRAIPRADSTAPVAGATVPTASAPLGGAPGPAGVAPAQTAPVLTREDSLRIAEAVRRRVDAAQKADAKAPGANRDPDSLGQALFRRLSDSLVRQALLEAGVAQARARAGAGAGAAVAGDPAAFAEFRRMESLGRRFGTVPVVPLPPTPRTHVVAGAAPSFGSNVGTAPFAAPRRVAFLELTDASGDERYAPIVRALNDSLRRALVRRGYQLASGDVARRLAGPGDAEAQRLAADSLGIGALVGGTVYIRRDALSSQVVVREVVRGNARVARDGDDREQPEKVAGVVDDVLRVLEGFTWRGGTAARRVVVYGMRVSASDPRFVPIADVLSDSLRALVSRLGFELVGDRQLDAVTGTAERRRVGAALGAGALIAGTLYERNGAAVARVEVRDMSAGMTMTPIEAALPPGEALRTWPALARAVTAALARIPFAPAGAPPPPAPRRP